jgi:hypothetical protein
MQAESEPVPSGQRPVLHLRNESRYLLARDHVAKRFA